MMQHFTKETFDIFLEGKMDRWRTDKFTAEWSGVRTISRDTARELALDMMHIANAFNTTWHGFCGLIDKNSALDKDAALKLANALVDFHNTHLKNYESFLEDAK